MQIKKAMRAIEESKRPIIYAGGGVIAADASEDLKKFVRKTYERPAVFANVGDARSGLR